MKPNRVAIYTRVAAADQTGAHLQTQLDTLRTYCTDHNLTIAGEYVDNGVSGALPMGERPDGSRLMEDAGRRFDLVLVERFDRLGRSRAVVQDVSRRLAQAGVIVRSAAEPFQALDLLA